jgi:hypothetical protein
LEFLLNPIKQPSSALCSLHGGREKPPSGTRGAFLVIAKIIFTMNVRHGIIIVETNFYNDERREQNDTVGRMAGRRHHGSMDEARKRKPRKII